MDINAILTCSYCTKIYTKPINLPCGDSLCEEHLIEAAIANEKEIKCCLCQQKFIMEDHQFILNKSIQTLIEEKRFLSVEEQRLKERIDFNLNLLRSNIEILQNIDIELTSIPKKKSQLLINKIDKLESNVIKRIQSKSLFLNTLRFVFFRGLPLIFFYSFILYHIFLKYGIISDDKDNNFPFNFFNLTKKNINSFDFNSKYK